MLFFTALFSFRNLFQKKGKRQLNAPAGVHEDGGGVESIGHGCGGSAQLLAHTPVSNPNDTVGKIVDLSQSNNKYTTMFAKVNVLTYTPYQAASRFCNSTVHGHAL